MLSLKRPASSPASTLSQPSKSSSRSVHDNNFAKKFPEIAAEWHPTRNTLTAADVFSSSNIKLWWLCKTTPICTICDTVHEWQCTVKNRSSGRGCPFCSGGSASCICRCKSLGFKYPEISRWLVNDDDDPFKVAATSHKKLLWRCPSKPICDECGTRHEWYAMISNRVKGRGCPFCYNNGITMCKCKTLAWRFPDVAKELVDGNPSQISAFSSNLQTWKCSQVPNGRCACGTEHVWRTIVAHRTSRGSNCPYCTPGTDRVCKCRSFGMLYPELAKEVATDDDPFTISTNSNKRLRWRCSNHPNGKCVNCGTLHEWETTVNARTDGIGCPWCSNKGTSDTMCKCNSLAWKFPNISGELVSADPNEVSYGSLTIQKWRCSKGHEYNASLNSRTSHRTGCPVCNVNKWEADLFEAVSSHPSVKEHSKTTIKNFYNDFTANYRNLYPDSIGTLVSGKRFMIETDGSQHMEVVYWFDVNGSDLKDQLSRDFTKTQYAYCNNISLLRISYMEYKDIKFWVNKFFRQVEDAPANELVMMVSNTELYKGQKLTANGLGMIVGDQHSMV